MGVLHVHMLQLPQKDSSNNCNTVMRSGWRYLGVWTPVVFSNCCFMNQEETASLELKIPSLDSSRQGLYVDLGLESCEFDAG